MSVPTPEVRDEAQPSPSGDEPSGEQAEPGPPEETEDRRIEPVINVDSPWRMDELLEWVRPPAGRHDSAYLADYRRAARQSDVPPDCADQEAFEAWYEGFVETTLWGPWLWIDARTDIRAVETEFGVSLCEVSAVAEGTSPRLPTAWLVDSPVERIVEAFESDPNWAAELELVTHADTQIHRWGDSILGDIDRVSAARPGGYGGQVVLDGDLFVRSTSASELHAVIDAQSSGGTLAAYDSMWELVELMDSTGAHSALIFTPVAAEFPIGAGRWESFGELDEAIVAVPKLLPYELFAIVWGAPEGETELSIVVLNTSGDAAVLNTDRLERVLRSGVVLSGGPGVTWLEWFDVSASYRTDSRLSIASIDSRGPKGEEHLLRFVRAVDRDTIRYFEDF